MPRKGAVAKREVLPDPIYNSKLVTRLINRLMLSVGLHQRFYTKHLILLRNKQEMNHWMFLKKQ